MGTQENRAGEEHGLSSAVSVSPGQRTRIRVHIRYYRREYKGDPEQGQAERKEPPRLQHLRLFHGLPGTHDLRKATTRIRSEIEPRTNLGPPGFFWRPQNRPEICRKRLATNRRIDPNVALHDNSRL